MSFRAYKTKAYRIFSNRLLPAKLKHQAQLATVAVALCIAPGWKHASAQAKTAGDIYTYAGDGTQGQSGNGGSAASATVTPDGPMVADSSGNLYFVDGASESAPSYVRKVSPAGTISLYASLPAANWLGIAIDKSGNLYASAYSALDNICGVYKIGSAGTLTLFAGTGTPGKTTQSGVPATSTPLAQPWGVAVDASGNVYIVDIDQNKIFEVTTSGIIVTFAGTGMEGYNGDNGPATAASFNAPDYLAIDASGNLYVNDFFNDVIREISPQGIVTTFAGNKALGFGDSGDYGQATAAQIAVSGLLVDGAGNLLFADGYHNVMRRVDTNGIISTIAGTLTAGYNGDGIPASTAELNIPAYPAVDPLGSLYIADSGNFRIRQIYLGAPNEPTPPNPPAGCSPIIGNICTLIPNASAYSLVNDSVGDIFYLDSVSDIYEFSSSGVLGIYSPGSSFAPYGEVVRSHNLTDPGRLIRPDVVLVSVYLGSMTINSHQSLYVVGNLGPLIEAGINGANTVIWSPSSSGSVLLPNLVAARRDGNFYVSLYNDTTFATEIYLVNGSTGVASLFAGGGSSTGENVPATSVTIPSTWGIAVDYANNLYYSTDTTVREINASSGLVNTIAGNGSSTTSGEGLAPLFAGMSPRSLSINSAGNIFLFDSSACTVRVLAGGIIKTIAGNGVCGYSGDGGPATSASLATVTSYTYNDATTVDPFGNLYISTVYEAGNPTIYHSGIREIIRPPLPKLVVTKGVIGASTSSVAPLQGVTFSVNVPGTSPYPTGNVTFAYVPANTVNPVPTIIGSAPLINGTAEIRTSFPGTLGNPAPLGTSTTYEVTGVYSGDANYASTTSSPVGVVVTTSSQGRCTNGICPLKSER